MNDDHSFDFLKKKYNLAPRRETHQKERRGFRVFIIILAVTAGAGFFFSLHAQSPARGTEEGSLALFNPFLRALDGIGNNPASDDRINILLLGIGGTGHEGPELTDTIILASLQPSTNQVSMLSIPRDLLVQIPGYGSRKINSVNALAELNKRGSGPEVTSEAIGNILDQEIDYYVKIDFNSFEELINAIGGVDIYVERSFADPTYPTDNYGIETISFEQGWQHMDGALALKYSRSRHGTNGEGSDFARATRQQKVITAVKDELLSSATILNPARLNQLAQLATKHVTTNMGVVDMVKLAKFAPDISSDTVRHFVLDDAPNGPLYSSYVNSAYVLLPKQADWSDLKYLATHIFDEDASVVTKPKNLQAATQETRVAIQNGTFVTGMASDSAAVLQNSGFTVVSVDNASSRDYTQTTIYDLTQGKKQVELRVLQEYFDASIFQTAEGWLNAPGPVPDQLIDIDAFKELEGVDFLIVLGQNAEHLVLR